MRPASPIELELPALQKEGVSLRTVEAADYPFLRALFRSVRDTELAPLPWTDAQKQTFCDDQFAYQDRHYRTYYTQTAFLVIERAQAPIGRLYLNYAPGPLGVMDIALVPAARGQGLGSALMQWLVAWADADQRAMQLFVEADNPARRLYQRLGFVEQGQEGIYLRMRRAAANPG